MWGVGYPRQTETAGFNSKLTNRDPTPTPHEIARDVGVEGRAAQLTMFMVSRRDVSNPPKCLSIHGRSHTLSVHTGATAGVPLSAAERSKCIMCDND